MTKKGIDGKFWFYVVTTALGTVVAVSLAWSDVKKEVSVQEVNVKNNTSKIDRVYDKIDKLDSKLDKKFEAIYQLITELHK